MTPVLTAKALAARKSLARRFHSGFALGLECFVVLDVLQITCRENSTAALNGVDFLRSVKKHWLKQSSATQFRPYARAHWFEGAGSVSKLCVESERQGPWLDPFCVTIYASDRSGLRATKLLRILEVLPPPRLMMLEIAFDFALTTRVSREFVRRHALFGKADRDLSVENTEVDRFGARRGRKRVKSYTKWEVAAHRVELRLKREFLDVCGIRDIFDFHKFADVLPRRHILFGRLNEPKLVRWLRNNGFTTSKTREILGNIHKRGHDFVGLLRYLRRDVGIKNVRRLVIPLPENRLVRKALREWAATWPAKPLRRGEQRDSKNR
jgi:hypothetical protein